MAELIDVPRIDIGPFLAGDRKQSAEIARAVAETCEQTGFLIIAGHRFPPGLLDRAIADLYAFFDQPDATKNQWHPTGPARQRGYHGFATRGLANTLGEKAPPDLRESLFLGPVDDHRAHYSAMPEAATSYAPNLIPDQPAGIDATLVSVYRAFEALAEQMMRLFGAALELPEGWFDGVLRRHFSILSCHHYPVLDSAPKPGQLRTGAHTDYGAMTILAATRAPGGLEVRMPNGSWAAVQPQPGEFVVNLGDMMAHWTNGRWASTLHRVVNPPLGVAQSRRLSIGMFVHPNYDQSIACVPSCVPAGEVAKFPPISAGEHIRRKIEASHAVS
ncbi:MAG: isopenicillin N synthase family dioxygenase [Betaproteobacteria bacterium]